ncbi:MAG: zinc-dependent alcohol dehydrogenase [Acidimicrobiales bacterium]
MLQAVWTPEGIEVVERDLPPRPDGWARLAVTGCGICGSDLHIYRGMRSGTILPTDYAVPGHEIAGTVVEGPAGLDDAVYAVEPWFNCRTCDHCARGASVLCSDATLLGISRTGGLADMVDVPARLLHRVPETVDPGLASLAEPWAVAVRALHRCGQIEMGERVLVLGGGTIGLLCGVAIRDRAVEVGITCRYPHQVELARRFGLTPLEEDNLAEWAEQRQPGIVIETVGGEADTMAQAIASARPGGRIVVVGVFGGSRLTDYRSVVLKELEVVGSIYYGAGGTGSEFGVAVASMAAITEELAALQTHTFALADLPAAFATADDKASQAVKVTITGGR